MERPQQGHFGQMTGDVIVQFAEEDDGIILERIGGLFGACRRRAAAICPQYHEGIEIRQALRCGGPPKRGNKPDCDGGSGESAHAGTITQIVAEHPLTLQNSFNSLS